MGLFGLFSNDEHDVRRTDKGIEKLTKNMSRAEKKEFFRRQEELELMDPDERRDALEEAGLDADEFEDWDF